LLWFAPVARLWTHVVNNEKQTLEGLKKTDDDVQWWFVHKRSKMNQNKNENTHTFQ
jgi:hypothetical protein